MSITQHGRTTNPYNNLAPPLPREMCKCGQPTRIGAQTGWVTTTTGYKVQGETSIRTVQQATVVRLQEKGEVYYMYNIRARYLKEESW